jgi:hypothetical protein
MTVKRMVLLVLVAGFIVVFIITGCSSIQDAVMGGVTTGVEEAVEQRVEQAVYKRLAPKEETPSPSSPGWGQFMATQAQIIFSYSFSAGGLWLGQTGYNPGEYTKFEWKPEEDAPVVLEKAFLKRLGDGKEWWRVSWSDEDGSWIYEALFSTGEDRELLRLRARDADGNEGEVPVTEGQVVYVEPAELTEESIEGATVERAIKVTTPAGTFVTDHVVYLAVTGEGEVEFWLTDEVPGGVVKYLISDKQKEVVWLSVLIEEGSNAKTILGSF